MENFFDWMSQPVPKEDVLIWFNIHNLNYEKIELYGDFMKSLYFIISDTYLGEDEQETRIVMSDEDKGIHFEWCWKKLLDNFDRESIKFKSEGGHKDYFKSFFMDSFYDTSQKKLKVAIPNFIEDVFNVEKPFTKGDLEILTELYVMLEKNIE
jgi:hypothetical protein